MFNFDIKTASIYQALKWEKNPIFSYAKILKTVFFALFLILFFSGLIFLGIFFKTFSLSVLFLVLGVIFWLAEVFFNQKLKNPQLKNRIEDVRSSEQFNLAEFLSFEAAKAVGKSIGFTKIQKLPEVDSSLLFYFLLIDNPRLNFIFSRALLDTKELKEVFKKDFRKPTSETMPGKGGDVFSKDFQETILEGLRVAKEKGKERIEIGDIIVALSKNNPVFQKILIDFNLKTEDIGNLVCWLEYIEEKIERSKRFWEYENLLKKGTLAKEWTSGYALTLDRFSIDWTETIRKELPEVIGHSEEIKSVERILARQEINNVLLVGEPGTGRKSIIAAIAKKSLLGQSLAEANYKRVMELDLPRLLAQIPSQELVEETLDRIFRETVLAGNIILIIDEFHNYIGQTTRPGVIDISGVISSYLHLPQFQIIAITTFAGLHENIEQNPSVLALFEKVEVSEISLRETLLLLENLALVLEKKHKKFISYPALRETISLTERYLPNSPFPEKAMELLDETVVFAASQTKDFVVLPSHVAKIISEKTQIPVGEAETKEKQILLNLENLIHQRIINQEEAVSEVSSALRRARADITVRKGPMGAFLFLGPTGVGKTETSKALAEIYFGSDQRDKSLFSPRPGVAGLGEERMLRLDMSEFQAISDIPRLLGSPNREGLLTTPVRENPFSLILLDEFEKAHLDIANLFLQVFDEGHLTDGEGRKTDFKNSIIIATSNAGYQVILEAEKKGEPMSGVKEELLNFIFKQGIFRPELINRFDGVVVFKNLTKENLLAISELLLQKLKKNLKEKGIDFIITQSLKEKIVDLGYNPVFGAREMRRVIQDKVENVLAQALLSGQLKRGDRAEINPENFQLKVNPIV